MGKLVTGITDSIGITDSNAGQRAAGATIKGSQIAAQAQMDALNYLKQQEALPTEFRDAALRQYGNLFLGGGLTAPTQAQIATNPIYQSILGTQDAAEEAVLRRQAATGGFRSGDTQVGLAQTAADIHRNALLTGYQDELARQQYNVAGLQSLAQLPSNASQIAGLTSGIGQTLAQGQTGAAQAQIVGNQATANNLLGLGQLGIGAALAFSDDKLKDNLVVISDTNHPSIKKYSWEWNNIAQGLGMKGEDRGYLASEIEKVWPELVHLGASGYRKIDLPRIEKKLEELK